VTLQRREDEESRVGFMREKLFGFRGVSTQVIVSLCTNGPSRMKLCKNPQNNDDVSTHLHEEKFEWGKLCIIEIIKEELEKFQKSFCGFICLSSFWV
jgi:hypothetical protein